MSEDQEGDEQEENDPYFDNWLEAKEEGRKAASAVLVRNLEFIVNDEGNVVPMGCRACKGHVGEHRDECWVPILEDYLDGAFIRTCQERLVELLGEGPR